MSLLPKYWKIHSTQVIKNFPKFQFSGPFSEEEFSKNRPSPGNLPIRVNFDFFRYYCFCGREENPESEYGATPHSCGQPCSRSRSGCNHSCNLLCHPGPCPPCEASEKVKCSCGKTEAFVKCGVQEGNIKFCSGGMLIEFWRIQWRKSFFKFGVFQNTDTILFYSRKAQMWKYLW